MGEQFHQYFVIVEVNENVENFEKFKGKCVDPNTRTVTFLPYPFSLVSRTVIHLWYVV